MLRSFVEQIFLSKRFKLSMSRNLPVKTDSRSTPVNLKKHADSSNLRVFFYSFAVSLMSAEPRMSTAPTMPSGVSLSCRTAADKSSANTGSM